MQEYAEKKNNLERHITMEKAKGKKAVFFSLLAMMLMVMLIFFFKPQLGEPQFLAMPKTVTLLTSYERTILMVENDFIPNAAKESLKRSLIAYTQYLVRVNDAPAPSIQKARNDIKELMLNNSIDGQDISAREYGNIHILKNNTLQERLELISTLVNLTANQNLTIVITGISIFQSNTTGPFAISAQINYTLILNQSPAAVWKRHRSINVTTSIIGLNDTFYYFNTKQGSGIPVYRTYKPSRFTQWDHKNVSLHIKEKTYIPSVYGKKGLSYLQRLANTQENPSLKDGISLTECCGLESFIHEDQGFKVYVGGRYQYKNTSFVDYCYFFEHCLTSGTSQGEQLLYTIRNITTDDYPLRISSEQVGYYRLSLYAQID
ncbi:MAG: hypothetical protein QW594_02990 [Candidatus Woesearchaeota archaeon]